MEQIRVLSSYNLGAKFCSNTFKNGVRILIQETIQFINIKLDKFCKEKDSEICAVKLRLLYGEICIITMYTAPAGEFQYCIHTLEKLLTVIYSNTIEIICGNININYLIDSTHKHYIHY
jgi:hypothetical protein